MLKTIPRMIQEIYRIFMFITQYCFPFGSVFHQACDKGHLVQRHRESNSDVKGNVLLLPSQQFIHSVNTFCATTLRFPVCLVLGILRSILYHFLLSGAHLLIGGEKQVNKLSAVLQVQCQYSRLGSQRARGRSGQLHWRVGVSGSRT